MSQLTVTAKTGPAKQVTASVIANVTDVNYDFARQVVTVKSSDASQSLEYDLTGVTTATITISAPNYTLVIS